MALRLASQQWQTEQMNSYWQDGSETCLCPTQGKKESALRAWGKFLRNSARPRRGPASDCFARSRINQRKSSLLPQRKCLPGTAPGEVDVAGGEERRGSGKPRFLCLFSAQPGAERSHCWGDVIFLAITITITITSNVLSTTLASN